MNAKEFIQKELIDGIGKIVDDCPYIAFFAMAAGIEFLGKCQCVQDRWNLNGNSENYFNKGLELFPTHYQNIDLFHSLRCGLLHCCLPENQIALSCEGNSFRKEIIYGEERTIIECNQMYNDFCNACKSIIDDNTAFVQKTEQPFYTIVDNSTTASTQTYLVVQNK